MTLGVGELGVEVEVIMGILIGRGGGSLSLIGLGGSGVEIERREAGSGVILPEDSVKCSPSGIFNFFGLLGFFTGAC